MQLLLQDVLRRVLRQAVQLALDGADLVEPSLRRALSGRDNVRNAANASEGARAQNDARGVRLSAHLYVSPADIDTVVDVTARLAKSA